MDQFSKRNIDKQGLKKKIEDVDEKIPNTSGLFNRRITTEKNTKIESKIANITSSSEYEAYRNYSLTMPEFNSLT